MQRDMLDEAQRLRAERRPFALATVVAARQPSSGTPGARAIITAGGRMEGWIGGHCAQPTVIRQGLAALADGMPRLVVLRPDGGEAEPEETPGLVRVPMLCASEGELHIFVEPFLPKIGLVVVGASPVARTLARMASLLDFDVSACDEQADMEAFPDASRLLPDLAALRAYLTARDYVVVATMNTYDEEAARVALECDASYVGVVASQRRVAALREALREQGVTEDRLARLGRPKGLAGPALRPAEIAFSVMADLLDARSRRVGLDVAERPPDRTEAIDPICGMTVDVASARYTSERDGQMYYFCCAGCKKTFERAATAG
ncbi:MAG TPA: XdhC family protein [Ktedonobacterales bacterium]|nr:XdhC family protein [Ktedonobacterales bacterium]